MVTLNQIAPIAIYPVKIDQLHIKVIKSFKFAFVEYTKFGV